MSIIIFFASFSLSTNDAIADSDPLNIQAEAVFVFDFDTGVVLYEKNADELLGVASMSKMMTEYIVLEEIEKGTITWEQKVVIDEYVHNLSKATGLSNVGLTQGEEYTIRELYEAMAIHSGNAATVALAQVISGTEKAFVDRMNQKAEELGLKKYYFVNTTGLNNADLLGQYPAGSPTDENQMSARDVGILAYRLIHDFPNSIDFAKTPRLNFRDGRTYDNFNWMLPGLIFEYPGVDGLKTGSTDFAGYSFTSTALIDNRRVVSVVMKAESRNARFFETKKMFDFIQSTEIIEEVISNSYVMPGFEKITVPNGKKTKVNIATKSALELPELLNKDREYTIVIEWDQSKVTQKENGEIEIKAPFDKGEVVGYATIKPTDESSIDFITTEKANEFRVEIVTATEMKKANFFVLIFRGIGSFFQSFWETITGTIGSLF